MGLAMAKNKKLQKRCRKFEKVDDLTRNLLGKDVPASRLHDCRSLSEKRDQYYADIKKAESWMRTKIPIIEISDYGSDENSSLSLQKDHESLMRELEDFGNTMQALKLQSSNIFNFESEKQLEGSQENLELENITSAILVQIEAQYNDLLHLANNRRKKLNQASRTYILLREANEHASFIEKATNNAKANFLKMDRTMDQVEFMENYSNFQINLRTSEASLYSMNEIIKEFTQLGKKEEVENIQIRYQSLNERWSRVFKELEPTYESHRFYRDISEINELIRDKLNKLNEMIDIGKDLEAVKALQKTQECFESELEFVTEKVRCLNEKQKQFMQTNPDIVVDTYSKLEEINEDFKILLDGMLKWKAKLFMCYEIYKSLLNCHEIMEELSIRLPRLTSNSFLVDRNNNYFDG